MHAQGEVHDAVVVGAHRARAGRMSHRLGCRAHVGAELVVACDAAFSRYAELDLEARCSASVGEPVLPHRGDAWVPVSLKISQQGATLSEATVRVADVHR